MKLTSPEHYLQQDQHTNHAFLVSAKVSDKLKSIFQIHFWGIFPDITCHTGLRLKHLFKINKYNPVSGCCSNGGRNFNARIPNAWNYSSSALCWTPRLVLFHPLSRARGEEVNRLLETGTWSTFRRGIVSRESVLKFDWWNIYEWNPAPESVEGRSEF